MTIGEKNRLIEIWKDTAAVGSELPNWVLHRKRWAKIKGETGMATIRGAATNGGVVTPLDRYSFRVNYDPTITSGMQVREFDGTRYNIVRVVHDKEDRDWTDIVAETGGSNG